MLGAAALIGYGIYSKGRALSNLIFSPGQINAIHFDGATPVIELSILAQNTNSASVPINAIAGNIYTQDGTGQTLIGNIYNFQPTLIQGNAATWLTLYCRCQIVGVVNEVISAFQYKNNTKNLIIQATANVSGIQFAVPEFTLTVGL